MLARFFIDRPVFAWVISIVIVLVGLMSLIALPIAQYPNITPPTIQVACQYPGANAQVVADTVAAPIEQQINGVENMMYMSSQSNNDGSYGLTVTFKLGVDLDAAQVLVQNRVQQALPSLPDVVKQTGVTVKKQSPSILLVVNLYSEEDPTTHKPYYDQLYLSNYATIQVKDVLARVDGVGDVLEFGQQDYSMRVWLDPDKLSSRNLTAVDVINALREQNIQVAAGQIGQQPAPTGLDFQYTMSTQGRLSDAEQFDAIVLKTGPDGQVTYLRDVSRSELGARSMDTMCRMDGKPSVGLAAFQLPTANALDTADRLRTSMRSLGAPLPAGAEIRHRLRHHAVHPRIGQRGLQDAGHRRPAGGVRGAAVLAGLEGGDAAADRRGRVAGRHLHRDAADGLHAQQPHAVRTGIGDRNCGR